MLLRIAVALVLAGGLVWTVAGWLPSGCGWAGDWASTASDQPLPVTLYQDGAVVVGHYRVNRILEATVSGRTLAGRWAAPPAFSEPANAGRFRIELSADCRAFVGAWGFGESLDNGGAWVGQREPAPDRETAVRLAYQNVLGRGPDDEGLVAWSRSPLPRRGIEAALRTSPEGERVTAVRELYRNLLQRDPLGDDNQGLRAWVDTRLPLDAVLVALRASDEARSRPAPR